MNMKDNKTKTPSSKSSEKQLNNLRKKVDELKKGLQEERSKSNDYLNKLEYLQAEFENYQKRVKKEIEDLVRIERERFILKIIDVLDELEIVVNVGMKSKNRKSLTKGLEMILKKFKEILDKEGLSKIEALGKSFNPDLHESVAKVQTTDCPDGTIIEELRKGYLLQGRLIRPSIVCVAKRQKDK